MNRRVFLGALGLLAVPRAAEAQPAAKVARIGVDLGYIEGRNVVIERRYDEGKVERLPALAAHLPLVVSPTPRHAAYNLGHQRKRTRNRENRVGLDTTRCALVPELAPVRVPVAIPRARDHARR